MAYDKKKLGSYQKQLTVIDGCVKCNLSNFRNTIVKYRGNPMSDIMVVAEGPGYHEDVQGKPMVGRTGTYLVNILQDNGLEVAKDYYITNCVLCRPPENATPNLEQLNACASWLNLQFKLVQPQYVLACGTVAAQRIIPEWSTKHRITKEEGNIFRPPYLRGALVIPIRHPSAIMRNPSLKTGYEERIAIICNMMKKGELF